MKVVLLGAGLVGRAIAYDIHNAKAIDIVVVDKNKDSLKKLETTYGITTQMADVTNVSELNEIISSCDLVIGALPGFLGYKTLRNVIQLGKNIVDISFFAEDPFTLDSLAKEKSVTAVIDAGLAPGLSNIIYGYVAANYLDEVSSFTCYVGGLPQKRFYPFEYKAPFSPIDVIEEYTRPARMIEYGQIVTKPALSDLELVDFPQIGTLEAFNTDGLRTLLKTMNAPFMREKTLRYPGHAEKVLLLKRLGFFQKEPIKIKNISVSPLDLTTSLLLDNWRLEDGEKDLTIMRIVIEGKKNGKHLKYQFDLYDEYDQKTQLLSMARTTGFTCSAIAQLVLKNIYTEKGIVPPEYVGKKAEAFQFIRKKLEEHAIDIVEQKTIYGTETRSANQSPE